MQGSVKKSLCVPSLHFDSFPCLLLKDKVTIHCCMWCLGREGPPSLSLHPQQIFSSEGFERIPRKNSASRCSSLPCQTMRVRHHPQLKSKDHERPVTPQGPQPHSRGASPHPAPCLPCTSSAFLSGGVLTSARLSSTGLSQHPEFKATFKAKKPSYFLRPVGGSC